MHRHHVLAVLLVSAAVLLFALVVLWRFTPLREYATADAAEHLFARYRFSPLAPAMIVFAFIVGGLVCFPVTIMIVATTATFGLWPGTLYAAAASVISAAVGYFIGHAVGAERLHRLLGPRGTKITRGVERQGVLAVTTVRIVPIAPFAMINLASGALDIKFPEYLLGTILGLAPGFAMLALAGDRMSSFMKHPSGRDGAILGAVLCAWFALSVALQALVKRRSGP